MMNKTKSSNLIQRLAALILGIAAVIYAIYHISSLFGEDIATIATGISTEAKVVDTKGYIFRDEVALSSRNEGVADYLVADGDKVSVGDKVANVYSGGTAAAKSFMRLLDSRIAILEKSVDSGKTLADLPSVNDDISDAYYSLAKMLASGETGSISAEADKLLSSMNCHSLLTDGNSPVDDTLASMKAQRQAMLESGGGSVLEQTASSGYFYSYVDGYEKYFTVAAADSITVDSFYALTSMTPDAAVGSVYGKLADSSEWRFVVSVTALEEALFKVGETYELEFTENSHTLIPMTLASELEDTQGGGKILVFHANRLPRGFVFGRCQSVSIEVSSVSGIYVPRSAVHRSGGHNSVYILKGSVVCYRRIEIVYEGNDYYLVATEAPTDSTVTYLGTNELLIIKGNNLFDGRILD